MGRKSKKIKRIALINPQGYLEYPAPLGKTDTGGQTVYVLQLARALGKKGIKVDIITRKFNGMIEEEQVFPNVKIIRIPCGSAKFVQKEKMYELMPEFVENIMKHMQKKKKEYDVIHSHYWDGGYAGYLLSKMLDTPHVYMPHSLGKLKKVEMEEQIEEMPLQKLKPMYRYHVRVAIEQKIMSHADAILVISELNRVQILQYYMVDFEKIHVIYPGIETDVFNAKKNAFDKALGMHENSVLAIARMVPAKGIDRIIDALALIKKDVDFHLYIGGDVVEDPKLKSEEEISTTRQIKELLKKYRLEKKTTMLGYVPHDTILPAYYRGAGVFVLAGRYEPFGLTAMEAMACGTPTIVSSIAGSKEVISDGLNGLIVDTHNRRELARKIKELLTNKKVRTRISQNAAFTIKEHYSWDVIVGQIVDLYKTLI